MIIFKYNKNINISESEKDYIEDDNIINKKIGNYDKFVRDDGTEINMSDVDYFVQAALSKLKSIAPEFIRLLNNKDILYSHGEGVKTMATDGYTIFIDPEFVEDWINECTENGEDDDSIIYLLTFVFLHECFHIVFNHCYEYKLNREKYHLTFRKVNISQDMQINYYIEKTFTDNDGNYIFKGMSKKLNAWINKEYGERQLGWEGIYDEVIKNKKKTSDIWKKGFLDGYKDMINKLRNENLIECYVFKK